MADKFDEMLGLEPESGEDAAFGLGDFGTPRARVETSTRQQIGRTKDEDADEDEEEETTNEDASASDESDSDESDASDDSGGHNKSESVDDRKEADDEEDEDEEDAENERRLKKIQADPNLQKANAALVAELRRLRGENKTLRMKQAPSLQSPQAPAPGTTTQPQKPARVRVELDEAGQEAFVPEEALLPAVERAMQRMSQPSPEQVQFQRIQQVTASFISEDPTNMELVKRANEVDDYLSQALDNLRLNGWQFNSMEDALVALKETGFEEKVIKAYPEFDGVFDQFVTNMADSHPAARRLAYTILKHNMQAQTYSAPRRRSPRSPNNGAKRPLGKQPASLGRKSGGRATPNVTTTDQREFDQLEAEFQSNISDFPEPKYRRLKQLAGKLGIEGY